jgi:hypothetical protein
MADKQHNMNARTGTVTIVTSDTVTTGTNSHVINGMGRWVDFTTANMQDTDSTNFVVVNEFGGTVFESGTKAESTTFGIGSEFPMHGTVDVVAVAEGTQSANRTIPYSITYDE